MKATRKPDLGRTLQFSVATIALAAALVISVSTSYGWPYFSWRSAKLMAKTTSVDEGSYNLSNILILNRVVLYLQENYVDPERVDPQLMLTMSLNEVQKNIAEVVVHFDRSVAERPEVATVIVGSNQRDFRLDEVSNLWEMSLKFQDVFRFVQENLSEDVDRKKIEYQAVNGMLDTLDPHSVLLSPEYYKNMKEGNRGKFGGLGITIRMVEGQLTVINPMQETPASRAGILKGDRIVKINEVATLNMELSGAVDLLRGEPGTKVTLTIDRESSDWEIPRPFTLTRDMIKIPSVEHANLGDNIGYIHLKGFQDNTYKDMVSSLSALKKEMNGELAGLVLDMRGNPGGLLNRAIEISDEFISSGTVVTTVGRSDNLKRSHEANAANTQPRYPIVVLINPGSASASEIVAGALKNNNRALIVGDRSFGKGSVQVLYEMENGSALKLTIAQYLTPGEVSIQGVGIVPDIKLRAMKAKALDDVDMYPERWVRREASLKSHLSNQNTIKGEKPSATLKYLDDTPEVDEDSGASDPASNHQVRLAKDLLQAAGETWKRDELLEKLSGELDKISAVEDGRLTKHFSTFDVDWSDGPNPAKPSLDVQFSTDTDPMKLTPGATVTVKATIKNTGGEAIHRLFGLTDSSSQDFSDVELVFGKLAPGASITRTFEVELDGDERTRFDHIALAIYAGSEPRADEKGIVASAALDINTVGKKLPHFALNHAIRDDIAGNGDGVVNPGERVHLRVFIENKGDGSADDPVAFLRSKNGARVELEDARRGKNGAIVSKQRLFHDFSFVASKDLGSEALEFEAHLYDRVVGRAVMEKIKLPVGSARAPEAVSGRARVEGDVAAILSTPTKGGHVVAKGALGDVLEVHGKAGGFFRVSSGDVSGWVVDEQLAEPNADDANLDLAKLSFAHTGSPPRLKISTSVAVTEEDHVRLGGLAEDDGIIRDYYVFVYSSTNHRYESRKVTYKRLERARAEIDFEVPLQPGLNRVKVVARDDDKMESYESVYIYRR